MDYVIVPEFIYNILLCGGIILSLASVLMTIYGVVKKKEKRYLVKWCIVLLVALILIILTRTGIIVANTMIGG